VSDDQVQAQHRLQGQGVLITGAAGSVGRHVAEHMAAEGAKLLLTDRPGSNPAGLPRQATFVEADLAASSGIDHLFEALDVELGRLDILVACAGVGSGPLMEMPEPDWRYVIESNLASYVACTQRSVERMRARGSGGTVILVGSISVHIKAVGESVYNAAKGGVASFAETLRKELMHDHIRVTLIEPGAIASAMQPFTPEDRARLQREHKLLPPEAVADAILFAATQPRGIDIVTLRIEPQIQKIS
jgi:NAD(P)-dependent dehydrogenase (short-subunit alcohol dehydrogenase family)